MTNSAGISFHFHNRSLVWTKFV